MSNGQILESFNKLFLEFLSRLSDTFPTNTKLKEYLLQYKIVSSVNETYFLMWYLSYTDRYKQYILNDDIEYFINNEDGENIINKDDKIKNKDVTLADILKCKELWETGEISQKTKESICQYVKALYLIAANYEK